MQTQLIINTLTTLIVVQLTLLSVFLLTSRKGRRVSNVFLAFFFILLIVNLADGILSYVGVYAKYPQLAHIEDGFVFLFGPTLYFYTLSIIYKDFKFTRRHLLHALPFIVLTILYQVYYHLQSEEEQIKIQNAIINRSLPAGFYISVFLIYAHVAIYLWYGFRHLRHYREKIKESFSSLDKINLDWLYFMLGAFALLLTISFIYTFLPAVGLKQLFDPLFILSLIFIFFFAIGIVWKGLTHPQLFSGIEQPAERERKYAESIRDEERASAKTELRALMEEKKLFLDPDLTLEKMAANTRYSPKRLSQLINDSHGQSFFDFVNSYRIREAESILRASKDPRLTILEVMYACGFNSKSSFNTIFKQKTGKTPTEYRKSLTTGF
jgi:AraC-like DNA-binding protein